MHHIMPVKQHARYIPSVDIKTWDIQTTFIVYQTFALSQISRLTIVTLASLFGLFAINS
jgi:hypothetical protein